MSSRKTVDAHLLIARYYLAPRFYPCVGLENMCFSSGLTPLMVGSNPADVNGCPERVVPLCQTGES